jgi:hypothetical protein
MTVDDILEFARQNPSAREVAEFITLHPELDEAELASLKLALEVTQAKTNDSDRIFRGVDVH